MSGRQIIVRWSHTTHEQVPLDYDERQPGLQIIRDIDPYKSMITGERIKSRAHHRQHLRDHGCIEVGNEKMTTNLAKPDSKKRKEILHQQFADMPREQVARMVNELNHRG